jgi:outer membrane receptor protein involved in Fe transport
VPAYHSFDAQVTFKVPASKASIKIGGTNIFNKTYIQYAGGPTLGGLYYTSLTFDGLLQK